MISLDTISSAFSSIQIIDASGNALALTAAGEVQVKVTQALPAGSNTIGAVNQGTSPWISKDQSDGPVAPGTVASFSQLGGGQYVAAGVTLTDQQQAALQMTAAGLLKISQVKLDYSTDNVAIKGSTGNQLVVNSDGSLNVLTSEGSYASWKVTQASATTTAAQLVAAALTNRKNIEIQNLGNNDVYLGIANTVTSANGLKLPKGTSWEVELAAAANVYAIAASGTADLRIAEYA